MRDRPEPPSERSDLVQAYVAADLMRAHLIKGFLDSEGIFSVVRGEHLMALQGEIPITVDTLPSIWVLGTDLRHARDLITRALSGDLRPVQWRCPECGEQIEGQFTECWQCGSSRESV